MKILGFVDYYISEWHAETYPALIKGACEKNGLDFELKYAYSELNAAPNGDSSDAFCEKHGLIRCKTIDELCRLCDNIIILAPSDPERHLDYANEVLKHGKRTYIDKTFAPSLEVAKEIFELSEKYGAKMFSTSALRYSEALSAASGSVMLTTFGGGSNFPEYVIHQAEMVIAALRAEPISVKVEKMGSQRIVSAELSDGKSATMIYSPALPFALSYEKADGTVGYKPAGGGYFQSLITDMLKFFEDGELPFDPRETLSVMKLRDAALNA